MPGARSRHDDLPQRQYDIWSTVAEFLAQSKPNQNVLDSRMYSIGGNSH